MNHESRFHRTASALAILALPLAYANVGLALIAINWDLAAFSDAARGFQLVVSHPYGAELTRWSMLTDMLGFYLLLVPLALVLWRWQKENSPQFANLVTLAGLGYLFFGALGAAILAVVMPEQIYAYAQATTADPAVHKAIFLAFKSAIYDGVWDTLNPLLAGVWWIGSGFLLRHKYRALAWATIVLGVFELLREVKIGPIALIGLAVYFVLAPIWAAWVGVALLRSRE
ncbi:MAG: hypothetical protein KKA73_27280 [Chloroflexi bacterium]|nr:hypothetical protein [Chloroflexota bacterium]MBU1751399.1 hypothetical protein [Chloroflexota bacterium]MBU1879295.1 hypothetical protein [Chloroflexota bacterium]